MLACALAAARVRRVQDAELCVRGVLGGRSSAVGQFNGGTAPGGDASIGVNGTWRQDWKFGLSYTRFLGTAGTFLKNNPVTNTPVLSYAQALKDRDFISFNIKRSF